MEKLYGVDKPSAAIIWAGLHRSCHGWIEEVEMSATFTSGSLFITFFILAKGNGGCR